MRNSRRTCMAGILVLSMANFAFAQVPIKTTKPDGTPNKAAWMAQGAYGMMVHYLIKPQGDTPEEKTADLNRTLANFDLDSFISQFDETGADWLIFTLAQGTGYLSSKSEFIDNVQWHCLLPVDLTFNPAVPNQYCHYTDKELFKFVDDVKSVGGAITINVPIDRENGHVPQDTHAQLARLGKYLNSK